MRLTLDFLWQLASMTYAVGPLFICLSVIIAALSLWVGHKEGWSRGDSLYFGFVTALTVGYGDFRPTRGATKFIAIVIGVVGLITSGILVAIAVQAGSAAFVVHR